MGRIPSVEQEESKIKVILARTGLNLSLFGQYISEALPVPSFSHHSFAVVVGNIGGSSSCIVFRISYI